MKYKVDLGDLKKAKTDKERNFRERLQFIKFWANYIKTHPDDKWSEQQNMLIDSQLPG